MRYIVADLLQSGSPALGERCEKRCRSAPAKLAQHLGVKRGKKDILAPGRHGESELGQSPAVGCPLLAKVVGSAAQGAGGRISNARAIRDF